MTKLKIKIPAQEIEFEIEAETGGPVIVTPPDPAPSTGFKVGVNYFPWTPMSLLKSIGMQCARVYCSSGWIWRPGGIAVQPMYRAETQEAHGLDEMLTKAKSNGVNVLLCIHQTAEFFRPTGRDDGANDFAPVKAGANRSDPASYRDYAALMFQLAARYGRVKHPDSALRVDTTPRWSGDILNEKKSGLDLLQVVEPWNEPDKFWLKGTDAYFLPEETAAMMSACYDGHEGALGAGVGIIAADPSMQVVMPALTDFDKVYFDAMGAWFAENRKDKKWPCSILSLHHYSNWGNKKDQIPAQWVDNGACLPKDDNNFDTIKEFMSRAKALGKPLIVSEFGADTKQPSMMFAKPNGARTSEGVQADIIIETIKAYKEVGVDAVYIFTGPDDYGSADGGQFETCGLWTNETTGYKPKVSAGAVKDYIASIAPKKSGRLAMDQFARKAGPFKRPLR